MAGLRLQGADKSGLGVLDRALAVAREAVIDPGVGEVRAQFHGDGEALLGPRRIAGGHPGLAKSVMGLRAVGLGEAGVARRLKRRVRVAAPQRRAEIAQPLQPVFLIRDVVRWRHSRRFAHAAPLSHKD